MRAPSTAAGEISVTTNSASRSETAAPGIASIAARTPSSTRAHALDVGRAGVVKTASKPASPVLGVASPGAVAHSGRVGAAVDEQVAERRLAARLRAEEAAPAVFAVEGPEGVRHARGAAVERGLAALVDGEAEVLPLEHEGLPLGRDGVALGAGGELRRAVHPPDGERGEERHQGERDDQRREHGGDGSITSLTRG
ncbi:MAG: hypothetical protein R3A52_25910 [Polyangiales bacterium]